MLLLLASVCISLHLEELTGKFKNCRLAGSKWLAATVTAAKLVLRWRLVVGFESQTGHSTDLCTFYHFNSFSIYSKKMHFAVRNRRRNMNKWKVDKDISNHSFAHSGLPLCQGTDCSRPCPCIRAGSKFGILTISAFSAALWLFRLAKVTNCVVGPASFLTKPFNIILDAIL